MQPNIPNYIQAYRRSINKPHRIRDYAVLVFTFLLLFSTIYAIYLLKQSKEYSYRAVAAAPDKLEIENAVLSGNVTVVNDSSASGGKYVVFNTQSAASPTSGPTPTSPTSSGKYPPSQTGVSYISVPSMSLPAYLTEVKDPTFAGSITRISNTDGWRNTYPKNQPWNADGSRAAFFGYGYRLLDGNTYQDLGSLSGIPGRPNWSNVDPDIIWGSNNGDNRLKKYRVSTKTTTYRAFSGYTEVDLGNAEGNLSDDDRYVALVAYPSSGGIQAMHFDIVADKVLYTVNIPTEPDWASVSHSGRYMVVSYGPDGSGSAQGYKVYDRLASNPSQPRHLANKTSHSDFARLEDGTEILVHIAGAIKGVRLDNGQSWTILSNYSGGHISGRAINRWGWVYLSQNVYYNSPGTVGHDQLIAVKTDGSGTVQVFAHARTIQPIASYVYAASTHAVPNRDGTKIMWGGRWNNSGGMYSYVVRVK